MNLENSRPHILASLIATAFASSLAQGDDSPTGGEFKSGYDNTDSLAGPASTSVLLAEDDRLKDPAFRFPGFDQAFEPWFDWKRELHDEHGLQLGVAYTSLYQVADSSLSGADSSAASAVLRISGDWALVDRGGKNEGGLVFSFDHRHRYNDQPPSALGFNAGYLGIPGTLFTDAGRLLGDFYWKQSFHDGRGGFIVGRYDPNDFFDVSGHANPWTTFQNLSILFNASTALADWSTGIGVGYWLDEQWYFKGAVNDVNGTATDIKFFDDFDELYTTAEVGWSPSREERYFKNVHVTYWHADEREREGVDGSEGIALGANWTWDEQFMLFTRMGWSSGLAPLYSETATLGCMYYVREKADLLGLAVNYGKPSDRTLGAQWTTELFYRFQVAQNFAITPSLQVVLDPALNPDDDTLVIGSIRTRFAF